MDMGRGWGWGDHHYHLRRMEKRRDEGKGRGERTYEGGGVSFMGVGRREGGRRKKRKSLSRASRVKQDTLY